MSGRIVGIIQAEGFALLSGTTGRFIQGRHTGQGGIFVCTLIAEIIQRQIQLFRRRCLGGLLELIRRVIQRYVIQIQLHFAVIGATQIQVQATFAAVAAQIQIELAALVVAVQAQ